MVGDRPDGKSASRIDEGIFDQVEALFGAAVTSRDTCFVSNIAWLFDGFSYERSCKVCNIGCIL